MAEAIGLAASIAGLVQLTGSVFKLVTKFCREAKDAPSKAQELATQTRELAGIFENLRLLASSLEMRNSNPSLKTHHLDSCQRTLDEINTTLNKAQADFDSGKSAKRFARRLKWPFSLSETKDLVSELANHRATLQLALSADSMDALLKSLSKQDEILNMIERKLSFDTRVQLNKRRKEVIDFFLRVKPQDYLDVCRELRHEATGSWLTSDDSTFSEWIDGANSKLWLSGIPGSGKTVLCGLVIETVLAQGDDSTAVCYAFCDYKNANTCLPENIVSALAVQLGLQGEEAFDLLEEYYDMLHPDESLPTQPKLDDLLELVECMAEVYEKVFVIVDGLDECGSHVSRMTQALKSVTDRSGTVSAAFFSRKEEEIREELEGQFEHIEVSAHTKDLEDYTLAEVGKRRVLKRLEETNPVLYKDILHTLVQGAQGMFRWVACQIDHICDQPNNNARKRALKELPPTLFGTYDRVLHSIAQSPPGTLECLRKALQWIALPGYELEIPALCEAVSVQDGVDYIDADDIIDPEVISRRCGCLLRKSLDGRVFEFAHFTVLEYLTNSPVEGFRYVEEDAYRSFAETSLRFILFPCFDRIPSLVESVEKTYSDERNRTNPFYRVAADVPYDLNSTQTISHVQVTILEEEPIFSMLKRLFSKGKNGHYQHWLRTIYQDTIAFLEYSSSPWHLAAFLGSPKLCGHLLEQGADVNEVQNSWPPMAIALYQMKNQNAEANFDDATALFWSKRQFQVLSILIDHGADVLAIRAGQSTLAAAFNLLHGPSLLPFVRASMPMPEDAVVAFSERIWNHRNDDEFLQAVLDLSTGDDAPPQWKPLATPALIHSRRRGIRAPGQAFNLPTHNYTDKDYPKALKVAIEAGFIEDLSALMSDPRFRDGACSPTDFQLLAAAAFSEFARCGETLAMLIDSGIDPNVVDANGHNALHVSCETINFQATSALLARGVDSAKGSTNKGLTPWHAATLTGRKDILEYLFEHDENALKGLSTTSRDGETPLALALREGLVENSLYLLEICPLESIYFQSGVPLLEDAAATGSQELFEALLAKGDIVTSTNKSNSTPIHRLSPECQPQFARYLSTMYDPFSFNESGFSPFDSFFERWLIHNANSDRNRIIPLDRELIQLLLPNDYVFRGDFGSVHAWQVICKVICEAETCCYIPGMSDAGDSNDLPVEDCEYYFTESLYTMIRCGIPSSYESQTGESAVQPLLKAMRNHRRKHFCDFSFASILHMVSQVSDVTLSLVDNDDIYGAFSKAIHEKATRLVRILTGEGVELIRRVPEGVSVAAKSLFEVACQRATFPLFQVMLDVVPFEHLNSPGPTGKTPIELLVTGSSPDKALILKELYQRGPISEPQLKTPLIIQAANESDWTLVKAFASLGYDIFPKWAADVPGLAQYAVMQDNLDMFKWVVESASENLQWQTTGTAEMVSRSNGVDRRPLSGTQVSLLHMAISNPAIVNYMLGKKLFNNLDIIDNLGRTPMHWAAFHGFGTVCEMLIAQGANPSIRDENGNLPIDYAQFYNDTELVSQLINAGSPPPQDIYTGDKKIYDPMDPNIIYEKAIRDGDLDRCKKAVLNGCSIDKFSFGCSCSPLFLAIQESQEDIVEWLIEQGASTEDHYCTHNRYARIAAHAANSLNSQECLESVLETSFQQRTMWHTGLFIAVYLTIDRENLGLLKVALRHFDLHIKEYQNVWRYESSGYFDTSSTEEFRRKFLSRIWRFQNHRSTLLNQAVGTGNLAIVKALIEDGADVNAKDELLTTPLIVAAMNNHVTIAKELLSQGANPEARDIYTLTATAVAVSKGFIEMVQLLESSSPFSLHYMTLDGSNLLSLEIDGDSAVDMFHYLISRGVSIDHCDRHGYPMRALVMQWDYARNYLVSSHKTDFSPMSIEAISLNPVAKLSCRESPIAMKRMILSFPPSKRQMLVRQEDNCLGTPLCAAASRGNLGTAKLLVSLGAGIEEGGSAFGTPLMCAIAFGRFSTVKFLVREGAKLEYSDRNGCHRSGVRLSLPYPKITNWLLVGRFQGQLKLEGGSDNEEQVIRPWSGKRILKVPMLTIELRGWGESTIDYCIRFQMIKRDLKSARVAGELV